MDRDLYSNLGVVQALEAQTITTGTNGVGIDLTGYSSLMVAVNVGESGDTLSDTVKIELELEESADDSTYTDVADSDLFNFADGTNDGTFAVIELGDDQTVYLTGYRGSSQYVRLVVNVTGTHTNGTSISAVAIRGHARTAPVN